MEGKKLTAEELKQALSADLDALAAEVVEALNHARDGQIIADSEEPVRDAAAVFRQRLYQMGLDLLQKKREAFSPSGQRTAEQRQAGDDAPDGQRKNRDS
jgi:hypothetical protein